MMRIVLVRHAAAVDAEADLPDRERSLARKGVRDARAVARRLRKRGLRPDLILSSPADRALETAHLLAEGLGYPVERVRLEPALYERTDAPAVLEVLRALPGAPRTVLLCGHEPQLSAAAASLAVGFRSRLSKGEAVGIALAGDTWQRPGTEGGRVFLLETPLSRRRRRRLRAAAERDLAERLAAGLRAELAGVDPAAAAALDGAARKAAARVVARFLRKACRADLLLAYRLRPRPETPAGGEGQAEG